MRIENVSYQSKETRTQGTAPCQNCGREVIIPLPFIGCVFCAECGKAQTVTSWSADSEHFKQPFVIEDEK